MIAIILAAGTSSRLAPYDDSVIPKILLPVDKERDGSLSSLLSRLLRQTASFSHTVIVCSEANVDRVYAAVLRSRGVELCIQKGDGQLGAVLSGLRCSDEDAVIVDGDNFFYFDQEIEDFAKSWDGEAFLHVGVFHARRIDKYAMVTLDGSLIGDIEEKPIEWKHPMIAKSGLLVIPSSYTDVVERSVARGMKSTTELIRDCSGATFAHLQDEFIDVGTWDDYTRILRMALHA